MAWVEPLFTTLEALSIANKLTESSSLIKKQASRILYRLKHGVVAIPIFGAGGVGKSTVGKLLVSEDPLDFATPYDESLLIEPIDLTGAVPGQILVAPGQDVRVERHWPELFSKVVSGKSFGIINVVSYGYHSFMINSYKEHDLYEDGLSPEDFMLKYTNHRRLLEIELLKKLLEGLSAVSKPIWMVTLINKQDLWWSKRDDVKECYESGEYLEIVKNFSSKIGVRNFQHEFLPVSLVLGNLRSNSGEILAQTTAGYDMNCHVAYLQSMFSNFYELIEQGVPR